MVKKESKKSLEAKCQKFKDSIANTIIENFDYFREHPVHLSWAIMNIDLVHRSARLAYDVCDRNINEDYEGMEDQLTTQKDKNLLSDAWDLTQMDSEDGQYLDGANLRGTYAEFAGYTKSNQYVREDIREKIFSCVNNPTMTPAIKKYLKQKKTPMEITIRHLEKIGLPRSSIERFKEIAKGRK